jgi:hypothetical protein
MAYPSINGECAKMLLTGLEAATGYIGYIGYIRSEGHRAPWHKGIFPVGLPTSIVAPATFHVQVRDGLAWSHCSKCTKEGAYSAAAFATAVFDGFVCVVVDGRPLAGHPKPLCTAQWLGRSARPLRAQWSLVGDGECHHGVKLVGSVSVPRLQPLLALHLASIEQLVLL